jgi:hypothetical protein
LNANRDSVLRPKKIFGISFFSDKQIYVLLTLNPMTQS